MKPTNFLKNTIYLNWYKVKQKISIVLHLLEKLNTLSKIFPKIKHLLKPRWFHRSMVSNTQGRYKTTITSPLSEKRGENTSSLILWGQHTLIPRPEKDITKKKKKSYRSTSLRSIDAKILSKKLANWMQQYKKDQKTWPSRAHSRNARLT